MCHSWTQLVRLAVQTWPIWLPTSLANPYHQGRPKKLNSSFPPSHIILRYAQWWLPEGFYNTVSNGNTVSTGNRDKVVHIICETPQAGDHKHHCRMVEVHVRPSRNQFCNFWSISTCGASALAVTRGEITTGDILKAANWNSESVF